MDILESYLLAPHVLLGLDVCDTSVCVHTSALGRAESVHELLCYTVHVCVHARVCTYTYLLVYTDNVLPHTHTHTLQRPCHRPLVATQGNSDTWI